MLLLFLSIFPAFRSAVAFKNINPCFQMSGERCPKDRAYRPMMMRLPMSCTCRLLNSATNIERGSNRAKQRPSKLLQVVRALGFADVMGTYR